MKKDFVSSEERMRDFDRAYDCGNRIADWLAFIILLVVFLSTGIVW